MAGGHVQPGLDAHAAALRARVNFAETFKDLVRVNVQLLQSTTGQVLTVPAFDSIAYTAKVIKC